MPIPFAFIGLGAAALGIGKGIKAGIDQKNANEINESAEEAIRIATKNARISREKCHTAIEDLGREKIWALDNSMGTFIRLFEQLHDVELEETHGLDELKKFRIDRQALVELKEMSAMASSIVGGVAGGAAAGALTALGAYGGVMAGTSIASLSGVAASNATLAFLGGGALSAGGLGMAGGTMVLGGLVAGPALAVMGFVVGAKASANKDMAYSNLAKAHEFMEEAKTVETICKAIRRRANMFEILLLKLEAIFEPFTESLAQVIQTSGTDFSQYSEKEKAVVAANLSIAKAIKAVLDTSILTEDGRLTDESEAIEKPIRSIIESYANR